MKSWVSSCAGLMLLMASACCAGPDGVPSGAPPASVSPQELTAMAQARFDEYLGEQKVSRAAATERTAAYLRAQPGVAKVIVRGTDSLFVLWDNGDELLMLLGRDRL